MVEFKDLVICVMFLVVIYMVFIHYRLSKESNDSNQRVAELECRVVVRLEDRITLLENDVAELESQLHAKGH